MVETFEYKCIMHAIYFSRCMIIAVSKYLRVLVLYVPGKYLVVLVLVKCQQNKLPTVILKLGLCYLFFR